MDPLNLQPVVGRNKTRYGAAAADYDAFRAAALEALAARAALTGDQGAALPAVAGNTATMVGVAGDQIADDAASWGAWWDFMPGVYGARATGIGAAGQAQFKDAKKKRMRRVAPSDGVPGGGSTGPYMPAPVDPYAQAYNDSIEAIRRSRDARPTYDPSPPAVTRPRRGGGVFYS